jgi:carboxyl-terminal processing protease
LLDEHYVASPDPASLAAAASLGLDSAEFTQVSAPSNLGPCVAPSSEFELLCPIVMEGAALGKGTMEDRVEAAVQGIFRFGLDPFSSYIEPDFADRLSDSGGGIVYSLGMAVSLRLSNGEACGPVAGDCQMRVTAVFSFGSAERAGVVSGDIITTVDGRPLDGRSVDEATALLYGSAGSETEITIVRDGSEFTKILNHEDIRFDPVEFTMLAGNVAYLRLNDFGQAAAQLTGLALDTDEVQNSRGLVLDLRANPGGLLLAAQAIASQFLTDGLVMTENPREGTFEWPVIEGGLAPQLPLVVLVGRDSASAAEVLAAVLKERGRATIVGDNTFGKNAVQLVFRARNGGEFRITTSIWTTPEGLDVGVTGLDPDVVVTDPPTADADPALETAISLLGG